MKRPIFVNTLGETVQTFHASICHIHHESRAVQVGAFADDGEAGAGLIIHHHLPHSVSPYDTKQCTFKYTGTSIPHVLLEEVVQYHLADLKQHPTCEGVRWLSLIIGRDHDRYPIPGRLVLL